MDHLEPHLLAVRPPKGALRAFDRHVVSRQADLGYRPGRAFIEALHLLDPPPRDVSVRSGKVAGIGAKLVVPRDVDPVPRMVWIHGGAFCFNSPRAYSTFVAHLARAIGVTVLAVGYRLAPEHPYPAALEDVLAAWSAVSRGEGPLLLGGDSAGGGLALSAAIKLRDESERQSTGLFLMSPWVDLTGAGESMRTNAEKDALLRPRHLPPLARAYAGDLALDDPRISPLGASLGQLPPTLIQVGGDELFLSEGTELAGRLETAGTQTELQVFDGVWHDFQVHAGMLRESDEALLRVAAWAKPLLEGGIAER